MSASEKRIERLEEAAGGGGMPCPLCERRERFAAEPARDDLCVVRELRRIEMDCPRCRRPFEIVVQYVERRAAA